MITLQEVENRLAEAGLRNRYWGRPEVRELQHIIEPDEAITHAVNGHYENGFCLIVATDRRLLLIDKKPLALNMHDLNYEDISNIKFISNFLKSTVSIHTKESIVKFTSFRQNSLRKLARILQERVTDFRQVLSGMFPQNVKYFHDPTTGGYSPVVEKGTMQRNKPNAVPRRRVSRFYPNNTIPSAAMTDQRAA